MTSSLAASLSLRRDLGSRVGGDRIALLEAIGELGSITAAAKRAGLSYKAAWDAVQALNNLFDQPLVVAHPGGTRGGAAEVTPRGRSVIRAFRVVEQELEHTLAVLERRLADGDSASVGDLIWSLGMRTSARNALRGVVSAVTPGAVNSEVALRISEGVEIVAIVTCESVKTLGLEPGVAALALIKSSAVILAAGEGAPRTSARNALPGAVLRREDGAVNSEITLELDQGKTLIATITKQSAEDLELEVGDRATALIKASHIILAVE